MTWIWALLLLQTAPPLDVSVEALSGPPRAGALVELDDQHIVIEADGKRRDDRPARSARADHQQPPTRRLPRQLRSGLN